MATKTIVNKNYYLFDCETENFGRIATRAATILQGKHKASYVPNVDRGDFVVLVNVAKARFSGNKGQKKMYHTFSGYPGGITSRKLDDMMVRDPKKVARYAIYNMMPKNKLRDKMMKKLLIFPDQEHGLKVEFAKVK
jgi:large subunit ribosomal protein L13